ncbi:aminodeoxychorismate/anthranilate synthase component II [Fulvivirga sp. M361]|uniref:anthranilate synthase component II n=1 Tax=Fulvivirga sp. M361 TaxID=2594266 RepID=UPI00117B1BAB|nr:aminodeoxychorismate/anthranilate synthase component II [Fulvivirga sp. M361]TRX62058.1 aminodeoxychorismate/anthranilate synthase component II [Fulvivirga sp. M361]
MKILVLDNYDSFTYNLVHIIRKLGYAKDMNVIRNDHITTDEVEKYDKILLSPGPGIPDEAGIMKEVIETYAATKSILGICLGHQGIAEVFGAELYNMPLVLHGITGQMNIQDEDEILFQGVPASFQGCHYHSWSVKPESVNGHLKVTAKDSRGLIMGISHTEYNVKGLQFHPESILTENGKIIIQNWLNN